MLTVKNMRTLILLLSLSWLTAVNASSETDDIVEPSPFCLNVVNAIGKTPDKTVKIFGEPTSKKITGIQNTHDKNITDKEVSLKYKNGIINYRYLSVTNEYLLLNANFPSTLFTPKLSVLLPSTRKDFYRKIGKPNEENKSKIRYYCTFESVEWVEVYFEKSSIIGFSYVGYMD